MELGRFFNLNPARAAAPPAPTSPSGWENLGNQDVERRRLRSWYYPVTNQFKSVQYVICMTMSSAQIRRQRRQTAASRDLIFVLKFRGTDPSGSTSFEYLSKRGTKASESNFGNSWKLPVRLPSGFCKTYVVDTGLGSTLSYTMAGASFQLLRNLLCAARTLQAVSQAWGFLMTYCRSWTISFQRDWEGNSWLLNLVEKPARIESISFWFLAACCASVNDNWIAFFRSLSEREMSLPPPLIGWRVTRIGQVGEVARKLHFHENRRITTDTRNAWYAVGAEARSCLNCCTWL